MAYKRNIELKYLENFYNRTENQIVVLYGAKYSGKMTLIKEFIKGKDYYYYAARACSLEEQLKQWREEIIEDIPKGTQVNEDYSGIISAILDTSNEKKVIIIDDFQRLIKYGNEFMETIIHAAHNKWNYKPVMFVLCSSSPYWVENSMVDKLKELAFEISGLLKLKDLKFMEVRKYLKNYNLSEVIETYAIIGGRVELLEMWDDSKPVSENVRRLVLIKGAPLNEYGHNVLPSELREPVVYNTLLTTLAIDKNKLNEIYRYTGFSRAKISVYLKNLIDLEIVEKVESFNTAGKENSQKGIYRIKDPFIHFWYRFVFRNLSKLNLMSSDKFFTKYILSGLKNYSSKYFTYACAEYLDQLNHLDQLRFRYNIRGVWVGKVGTIDIVAQNDEGKTLVALCNYEKQVMSFSDYEWLVFCIKQAKLDVSDIYLFSAGEFDLELNQENMINESVHLIAGNVL